jgi:hypothetical protein
MMKAVPAVSESVLAMMKVSPGLTTTGTPPGAVRP